MSKILRRGETGFGLLYESDAGYISKDLNPNILNEGVIFNFNEPILIKCILQKWGVENKNGRIYPENVLVPQIKEYQKLITVGSAVSEADHPECLRASDSEILTKTGWKLIKDISENEEILTLNTKSNKIEIQKIEKKIHAPYKGVMYKIYSKSSIDLIVTPNHRFLIENDKGKRFYETAENIYNNVDNILSNGKNKLLKTADWEGEYKEYFTLPPVDESCLNINIKHNLKEKYLQPINIKSEDWFAFLGFYLAEGHATGTKSGKEKDRGYTITVTQKHAEKKIIFEKLIKKLPFKYSKTENLDGFTKFHINDARLYNYLYPLGYSFTKYVPVEIKNASKDLLNIFFDWFLLGDGRNVDYSERNGKINNRKSVFSTSKQLINDLQEILIKIGKNGNISVDLHEKDRKIIDKKLTKKTLILEDGTEDFEFNTTSSERIILAENSNPLYNLNVSKSKNIYLDKRFIKIEKIDFDDEIACVRVPNGNFMVRVNGKSHWTGNSSIISLSNLSHMIKKMWWGEGDDRNVLYGELEIINSPGFAKYGIVSMIGDKILVYLTKKIRLGISSRGVGTLKEVNGKNVVQNDFELVGFDLVSTPSTPGAYLFPENSTSTTTNETKIKKYSQQNLNEEISRKNNGLMNFLND